MYWQAFMVLAEAVEMQPEREAKQNATKKAPLQRNPSQQKGKGDCWRTTKQRGRYAKRGLQVPVIAAELA